MNKTVRIGFCGVVWFQTAIAVMLLAMSTSAAALDSDGFVFPVLGVSQTDPVTNTSNPLDDGWHGNGVGANVSDFDDGHLGQDYAKAGCAGLPVYAVSKGKVVQVIDADNQYGWADGGDHGWGRVIIIEHTLSSGFKTDNSMVTTTPNEANPRKVYSLYGHLKRGSILVSVGAAVDKGQKIAEIGQDGVDLNTGGSHLHFEIKNGSAYASKECCVSQPTYGVGFGYSGKSDYAPNRYIPSVFIENNKAINRILIKPAGGTTIYWLQHGIIYPVSAPSVIDTMKAAGIANWDWGKVVTVSDISKYTTGPTILTATSASDNLLVKDVSTKRIYKMNNGVKEYQSTLASFADVIDMAPAYFAQEASGTYTAGQSAPTDAIRQVFAATYDANSADLGSPTDVVKATSSATGVTGYYQTFANGSIQYMASGANAGSAFAVYGEIYDKWAQLHYANSPLGLPTGSQSEQFTSSQGTTGYYQSFEGGSIQVNIKDNIKYAYAVYGKIYEKWGQLSYATGDLGLPIGDIVENVRSGFGTTGSYQRFENGSIQVIGANAYAVSGAIYGEWGKHGYAGKFTPGDDIEIAHVTWAGFPASDAYAWSGITRQDFEGGYIVTNGGTTADFVSDKHPQGLTAAVQTGDTIRLAWQNRIASTGVNVYRSGSPTELIATVEGSATSYTDTAAATGHAYTYFVSAYNETAESPASNLASMSIAGTGQNILTVSKAGLGSGTVTSDDGLIDCGYDCSEVYDGSPTVTLTAQPSPTSTFGGWSGACTGASVTCTFTVNTAIEVTSSFNRLAYEPRSPGEEEIIGMVTDLSSGVAITGVAVSTTNASTSITIGGIQETFDGQTIGSQWTLGGNANPFISSDKRVQFGDVSDNQYSSISRVQNILESTTVSFDYQVSSESGYDYLRFYVDSIEKQKWSGSTNGTYSTNITAGNHTFLWKYTKDGSASAGSDTAWIDNISIGEVGTPGHYTLGPLSPGTYIVTYSKAGYQSITTSATILAGQATILDVAMPISLSGTVKDLATNLPLSGVAVTTTGANVTTDANGKYTLGSLVPGDFSLTFSKAGYQPITKSATVLAGQATILDVAMPISLSGTVKDMSTGNLITSVTVTATGGTSAQTTTSGYYALGSLPPGVYDVTFSKSGYQTVTASNVVIRAGDATVLNMELTIPGYLTITVSALPPADTGNQYNPRIKITGGVWPYTYSIGVFPASLRSVKKLPGRG